MGSHLMRIFFLVLALGALTTPASGYSSGFASGSSYASGSSAAPTPTPTPTATPTASPTPAPPGKKVIHIVKSKITLAGVSAAAFDKTTAAGQKVRQAFKATVAASLSICGSAGTSQCTHTDVVIVSVSRRRRAGATVDFYVKTSSSTSPSSGAATLNTFLNKAGANGFTEKLKAEATKQGATELAKVTGTTVVVAPTGTTSTVPTPAVAAATATAAVTIASFVTLAGALVPL